MTEKNVPEKVEQLKKEIAVLSSKLKELGQEKEAKYKEKESITRKLNTLIQEANTLKETKDSNDSKIKESKILRDKLNLEVKSLANQIKEVQKNLPKPEKGSIPTGKLNAQIKILQKKVETEVMAFEKEKAIMKQVRELEDKIKANQSKDGCFSGFKDLKKAINEKKKEADQVHKTIQELAKANSETFKTLTAVSKEIAQIKTKKLEYQGVLFKLKNDISRANARLGEILKKWSEHKKDFGDIIVKQGLAILREKTKVAKEKLAGKKKLTTEDIMALQREGMR